MVDFHTHILPGIDDGSIDPDMSVEMLMAGIAQGVDIFVFTPHFNALRCSPEEFLEIRRDSYASLQTAMNEAEIETKIFLGCECYYVPNLVKLDNLKALCIEGTNVLMLEPAGAELGNDFFRDLDYLVERRRLDVVIAHVERYINVFNAVNTINKLRECGAYIQSNAHFFTGSRSRMAKNLYKKGLIDVLGSDCHNMTDRAPDIKYAAAEMIKAYGIEKFREFENIAYELLGNA